MAAVDSLAFVCMNDIELVDNLEAACEAAPDSD